MLLALLSVPFWHAPAIVYWGRQGVARSLVFAMVFSVLVALLGMPQSPSLGAVLVFVTAISLYLTLMYTSLWFTVAGCFDIDADAEAT